MCIRHLAAKYSRDEGPRWCTSPPWDEEPGRIRSVVCQVMLVVTEVVAVLVAAVGGPSSNTVDHKLDAVIADYQPVLSF